jgi:hypothetical protein
MVLVILALITIPTTQAAWPRFDLLVSALTTAIGARKQFGILGGIWAALLISTIGIISPSRSASGFPVRHRGAPDLRRSSRRSWTSSPAIP